MTCLKQGVRPEKLWGSLPTLKSELMILKILRRLALPVLLMFEFYQDDKTLDLMVRNEISNANNLEKGEAHYLLFLLQCE